MVETIIGNLGSGWITSNGCFSSSGRNFTTYSNHHHCTFVAVCL